MWLYFVNLLAPCTRRPPCFVGDSRVASRFGPRELQPVGSRGISAAPAAGGPGTMLRLQASSWFRLMLIQRAAEFLRPMCFPITAAPHCQAGWQDRLGMEAGSGDGDGPEWEPLGHAENTHSGAQHQRCSGGSALAESPGQFCSQQIGD